ncbi:MAG: hypothetical protein IJZ93_05015 [Clostridia bacterium]|nr:hypothetical protein [Clostridia bacterium]
MPIWLIILLIAVAILLLTVVIVLSSCASVHIIYDKHIRCYTQFGFIKIRLFRKHKFLKEKFDHYHESDIPSEKVIENNELFYEDIIDLLEEFKELSELLTKHLIDCVTFKISKLDINIGGKDAVAVTFAHNAVVQSVAYFVGFLDEISNIDLSSLKNIVITPNYISQKSHFNASITMRLPILEALKRLYLYI